MGAALVAGIGPYVLKGIAWALAIAIAVVYAFVGAILIDTALYIYARLHGERRGFDATRWLARLVAFPFRPIIRARDWWRGPKIRVATIGELLMLTPDQFEEAIGTLLGDHGYTKVERVGRTGDLAVDLTARDSQGLSVGVQCKRYAPGARVGSKDIQLFVGMLYRHHQLDRGIYVTTASYTKPASDLARQHGIRLIDGFELARLLPNGPQSRQEKEAVDPTVEQLATETPPPLPPPRPNQRGQNEALLRGLRKPDSPDGAA